MMHLLPIPEWKSRRSKRGDLNGRTYREFRVTSIDEHGDASGEQHNYERVAEAIAAAEQIDGTVIVEACTCWACTDPEYASVDPEDETLIAWKGDPAWLVRGGWIPETEAVND